jgi:hypothetical protein
MSGRPRRAELDGVGDQLLPQPSLRTILHRLVSGTRHDCRIDIETDADQSAGMYTPSRIGIQCSMFLRRVVATGKRHGRVWVSGVRVIAALISRLIAPVLLHWLRWPRSVSPTRRHRARARLLASLFRHRTVWRSTSALTATGTGSGRNLLRGRQA